MFFYGSGRGRRLIRFDSFVQCLLWTICSVRKLDSNLQASHAPDGAHPSSFHLSVFDNFAKTCDWFCSVFSKRNLLTVAPIVVAVLWENQNKGELKSLATPGRADVKHEVELGSFPPPSPAPLPMQEQAANRNTNAAPSLPTFLVKLVLTSKCSPGGHGEIPAPSSKLCYTPGP